MPRATTIVEDRSIVTDASWIEGSGPPIDGDNEKLAEWWSDALDYDVGILTELNVHGPGLNEEVMYDATFTRGVAGLDWKEVSDTTGEVQRKVEFDNSSFEIDYDKGPSIDIDNAVYSEPLETPDIGGELEIPDIGGEVELNTTSEGIKRLQKKFAINRQAHHAMAAGSGDTIEKNACPTCGDMFRVNDDAAVKGDENELYCSIECLNEEYV